MGNKDTGTDGAKDQIKGGAKQDEGRVRSTVGSATGDTKEELKGKGQELKGKVQREFGKAKQESADTEQEDELQHDRP